MADRITDTDLVEYIEGDPTLPPELIPFMYGDGILKKNKPIKCSRWGVRFQPVHLTNVDPRTVAIHESGHAMVLMAHGAKFKFMEFGGSGSVAHLEKITLKSMGPNGSARFWKQSDADAISVAGGPVATSELLYKNSTTWVEGCFDDFVLLCVLDLQNGNKAVESMIDKATTIVEKDWKIVEALANELIKTKKVGYSQCLKIANRVDPAWTQS